MISIEENIGLARFCAEKFKNRGIEYDDIFQSSCETLVKAAKAFDESRGIKFSTYAVAMIFGALKQLFKNNTQVKFSRSVKDLAIKINKTRDFFIKTEGKEPTLSEISDILNVEIEKILESLEVFRPVFSIEIDDKYYKRTNLLNKSEDFENEILQNVAVSSAIKKLNESDEILIKIRFFNHKTQKETAKILGTTQVQVSRREKKILKFLKKQLI